MTSRTIIKLALRALNEIKNHRGIAGLDEPDIPHPFNGMFSSYDLAAAIDKHLKATQGFTVILGYPEEVCEKPGETYSGTSGAATWEEAVTDVAEQMFVEGNVDSTAELTIVDVFEGTEHDTFPGTDRYAVVRFNHKGTARLLDSIEAEKDERFGNAWMAATEFMEHLPDMKFEDALKQAIADYHIPPEQETEFIDWAQARQLEFLKDMEGVDE